MDDKSRERRARRVAVRQGLMLKKSRARVTRFDDQGGYMIIERHRNLIEAGEKFDLNLDDVERFLRSGKIGKPISAHH